MATVTLNNGVEIPQLGFGTAAIGEWQKDNSCVTDTILKAMSIGYRHFDTASVYGNERALGRAIRESGLPRRELFITSKVWDTEQGRIAIPKAGRLEHIRNNFLLSDFILNEAEIEAIDGLNRDHRFGGDPDTVHEENKKVPVPAWANSQFLEKTMPPREIVIVVVEG